MCGNLFVLFLFLSDMFSQWFSLVASYSSRSPVHQPPSRKSRQKNCHIYGCFLKWWYPQIIHFNRVFHYKPSILGYHHFRKPPYILRSSSSKTLEHGWYPHPNLLLATSGCDIEAWHWRLMSKTKWFHTPLAMEKNCWQRWWNVWIERKKSAWLLMYSTHRFKSYF